MIAEELARRASFDWVKSRAREKAAREVRVHPVLASAIGLGVGAAAVFFVMSSVRRRPSTKKSPKSLPKSLPKGVTKPLATTDAGKVRTVRNMATIAKEGGQNAWAALRRARASKTWIDQLVAPIIGVAVVLAAVGVTRTRARARLLE